jgi:hypothetical protein
MESLKKLKEEEEVSLEEEGEGGEEEGGGEEDEGEASRESSSMAVTGTEEQNPSFSTLDSALDLSERNYGDRKDKFHATKDARFQYYLAQKTTGN